MTFLALIIAGAASFAQSDVKFKKILNGDNAMSGTRSIFKDSEGFVWLGISDPGFIRLQGKNVRTYGAEAIADKYFCFQPFVIPLKRIKNGPFELGTL